MRHQSLPWRWGSLSLALCTANTAILYVERFLTSLDFRFLGLTFFAVVTKVCNLFNDIPNSLCFGVLFQWLTILIFDSAHKLCAFFATIFEFFVCVLVCVCLSWVFISLQTLLYFYSSSSLFLRLNEKDFLMSFYIYIRMRLLCAIHMILITIRLCYTLFSVTIELSWVELSSYKSHKSQLN